MSLGREFAEENAGLWELYMMEVEERAKRGVWQTKEGEEIPVTDMTTTHILNTISFLKRKEMDEVYEPWIHRFENELARRKGDKSGEMKVSDKLPHDYITRFYFGEDYTELDEYGNTKREILSERIPLVRCKDCVYGKQVRRKRD